MRAMMKTPDKRYASAIDMVVDLKKVLTDDSVVFDYDLEEELPTGEVTASDDKPKEKFWTKNNIIALCSGVAAGLVVIATVVILFFAGGSGNVKPSESAAVIEVPNFVGKAYTELEGDASIELVLTAQEEYNADYDKGYVFEQSIAAGTEVQAQTEVIVKVSLGSKSIVVPNIANSEQDSAIAALDKLGIDYQIIKQQSDDVKENYVIRTQPAAGEEISEGKTLFVYVSTGSDAVMVEVPDCIGKDKNTAIMLLSGMNLAYQIFDEEYSDTYKAGVIIEQSPKAGTQVEEGREILLIVSKGPNPSASNNSGNSEND
jgi:serine/threonine-protein kinase